MAFVAETNDKVVGAVWVRIMDDYGHVDDDTPSLQSHYSKNTGITALEQS